MQPMKCLRVALLGVLLAVFFAPLDAGVSGGGVQVSSAYAVDIAHDTGPVCVALTIKPGPQGKCPAGQVEIPNVPGSGGAIIYYLKEALFLINSLIGGIIILVLVVAGIQYITSAGEPANVKSAKGRVMNAVIALVLYLMMMAILNFLIPGGLL